MILLAGTIFVFIIQYTIATIHTCSCQCPYGFDHGYALTRANITQQCIEACIAVPFNPCTSTNTYACLGTNCAYSNEYDNTTAVIVPRYRCICQCPHGSIRGFAYVTENSSEACVTACIAVPFNPCTSTNTYACLGTDCAYSSEYNTSTTAITIPQYRCSCQCPYGDNQGFAYATENSSQACIMACVSVPFNPCRSTNTYACLENDCAYSSEYDNTTAVIVPRYRCTCQCPYGSMRGFAYATENSSEACVTACIAVPFNPCRSTNTYACLGTNCVYSSSYDNSTTAITISQYRCSCQCPYGDNQGFAYAAENSSQACTMACINVPFNPCRPRNTYACLGMDCAYSSGYDNRTAMIVPRYRCSCECPSGSIKGFAYATENSTEACVRACIDVPFNPCTSTNTYACLGTDCTYSSEYNTSTTAITIPQYRCTCQCPYGDNQGFAYATENSSQVCVTACIIVPFNPCRSTNTYACLGTDCIYSSEYDNATAVIVPRYRCSCECPYGSIRGFAYTTENSTDACVRACIAVPFNPCTSVNTYACLGTDCAYSNSYDNSTTDAVVLIVPQYRCSCQCPYGSNQSFAYAIENSAEACVRACIAVPFNPCNPWNTYACSGNNCVYSNWYLHSRRIVMAPRYRCSCPCTDGSNRPTAYAEENSPEGCAVACNSTIEINRMEGMLKISPPTLIERFSKILNDQ